MRCEAYCLLYILCVLTTSRTTVKIFLVCMVIEIEIARWRLLVNSVQFLLRRQRKVGNRRVKLIGR